MTDSVQPTVSIIIPAYNKEKYIGACLDSALQQTLKTIEIIVVDDGSTDNTSTIISDYAHNDSRIIHLTHSDNKGRHTTRLTGVAQASGLYTMFLDADDTLALTACETLYNFAASRPDADIVRYGANVNIADTEDPSLRTQVEILFNATVGDCNHEQILQTSFSAPHEAWVPWNVNTSLFKTSLIQEAFRNLKNERLNKIEDAYEYLAISALSHKRYSYVEYRGLQYHFGSGISSRTTASLDVFDRDQRSAWEVDQAVQDFAVNNDSAEMKTAARNFHARSLKIVSDDFIARLSTSDYSEGLRVLQKTWGKQDAYLALHKYINSHLYTELCENSFPLTSNFELWSGLFLQATEDVQLELDGAAQDVHMSTQYILKQIRAQAAAQEAEQRRREYEESLRIFKTGTKAQYYFDKLLPLGTHRRGLAHRLAKLILRR